MVRFEECEFRLSHGRSKEQTDRTHNCVLEQFFQEGGNECKASCIGREESGNEAKWVETACEERGFFSLHIKLSLSLSLYNINWAAHEQRSGDNCHHTRLGQVRAGTVNGSRTGDAEPLVFPMASDTGRSECASTMAWMIELPVSFLCIGIFSYILSLSLSFTLFLSPSLQLPFRACNSSLGSDGGK